MVMYVFNVDRFRVNEIFFNFVRDEVVKTNLLFVAPVNGVKWDACDWCFREFHNVSFYDSVAFQPFKYLRTVQICQNILN